MNEKTTAEPRDFDAAYRARLEDNREQIALWAALMRATDVAEHPVAFERLAADLGRPVEDTLALIQRYGGDAVQVQDGRVHLRLTFPEPDAENPAQYRIHIGGRVLDTNAGGCAGDIFAVMLWTGKPLRVETTCPVTGAGIRVDIAPTGITRVEPATAVISVVDPHSAKFQQFREDPASNVICRQQSFYASRQAAADDPILEPGARVFPVGEFLDWTRRIGVIDRM